MPFHITQEHMSRIAAGSRAREGRSTKDYMTQVKQSAEIGAVVAGLGYLQGWNNEAMPDFLGIPKVPTDLGLAVVLHGLAFADVIPGGISEDLHNMGDGALASYLFHVGNKLGSKNPRKVADTVGAPGTSAGAWPGQMGMGSPSTATLTPEQAMHMAQGF